MTTLVSTRVALALGVALMAFAGHAQADAVTDWNQSAGEWMAQARLGTPQAVRAMALVQTAVHEAVGDVQRRHGGEIAMQAAVASANRGVLGRLLPQQQADIDQAVRKALATLPDAQAAQEGVAAGEQAAARVLAWRAHDGAAGPDLYRPHAQAGHYVPTSPVATPHWGRRTPWLMTDGAQFRPGPPPRLDSARWARDYNEVKAMGARQSTRRSAAQTEVARFWEYAQPPIYLGVLRSLALAPGRSVARNARLYAAATQAMDDAVIAVMDAKYHHGFWRPVTAIRNGDRDGRRDTVADPGWAPLVDNPAHPEYPSAHSILAAAVGQVIRGDVGRDRLPELATSSPTAAGAVRRWASVEALVQEVADARVWEGIHFRHSTEVGLEMGRRVGALAAQRVASPPAVAGLPAGLWDGAGLRVVERLGARGVQVHECRADPTAPGGAGWTFVGPEAVLFDEAGAEVGSHGAGPHWQAADGSRVTGTVQARAEAPQPDAVPWLRLSARSVGGAGRWAGVSAILRIHTHGGMPPAQGCTAQAVGRSDRVPYTADYLMLAP